MNFDNEGSKSMKDLNSKKKMFVCVEGGGGGTDTEIVCKTVSLEVKYRNTTIYTM